MSARVGKPCIAHRGVRIDRGDLENFCRWKWGSASDYTAWNDVSTLLRDSIGSIIPDVRRKRDLIADRTRMSSKDQKHVVAYKWNGKKEVYDTLPTSRMMAFVVLQRVDGYRQPCNDSRAKISIKRAPHLKGRVHSINNVDFRNTYSWRRDSGRSSDQEVTQSSFALRSTTNTTLFLSYCTTAVDTRDLVPCCLEVRFSTLGLIVTYQTQRSMWESKIAWTKHAGN